MVDHFEVATDSETQVFLGALVSKPIDWERFSQFNCLKFIVMRILKTLPEFRNLTLADFFNLAESKIWFLVQLKCFSSEIFSLKKTMMVQSKSKVIGLLPFLASDGIMRERKTTQSRFEVSDKTLHHSAQSTLDSETFSGRNA